MPQNSSRDPHNDLPSADEPRMVMSQYAGRCQLAGRLVLYMVYGLQTAEAMSGLRLFNVQVVERSMVSEMCEAKMSGVDASMFAINAKSR